MERLSTLALFGLLNTLPALAQSSDIVVFSEMGEKFTLVIDGDVKNEAPAARVVAPGIRNETPLIMVRFADAGIAPIKQNGYMEFGKEYTLKITTNKKGERVLRMQGEAAQGTAAATMGTAKPTPTQFVDDGQTGAATGTTGGSTTTTTTSTTETTGTDGQNMTMNVGINGMGVNMNVGVNDGTGNVHPTGQSTTTTTTTTVTSSSHTVNGQALVEPDRPAPARTNAYHMPGYTGPIGCPYPMSDAEFSDAKQSISSKDFEESKMTTAKQVAGGHCFTAAQVKEVMGLFGFEDSKLTFAKFAYDHTYDIGNYYKVNDAFGFESSIDDLNHYIQSH